MRLAMKQLSPTHSDIAICEGYTVNGKIKTTDAASSYTLCVALDGTADTMNVKIPATPSTASKIQELRDALIHSDFRLAGVRFDNINIRKYDFVDKRNIRRCGYTATADSFTLINQGGKLCKK